MNNSIQSFRTAGWPIWAGSRISSWPLRSWKAIIIHKIPEFLSFFNKFSINRYSSVMDILSVNIQYWQFTVVDANPKPLPSWHTHILLLLYKKYRMLTLSPWTRKKTPSSIFWKGDRSVFASWWEKPYPNWPYLQRSSMSSSHTVCSLILNATVFSLKEASCSSPRSIVARLNFRSESWK